MDIKASIFSHILKYFLENINFYIGLWAWLGGLRLSSQCSGSRGMQISGRLGPAGLQRVPGQSKFYGEALSPKKSYMWTVALFLLLSDLLLLLIIIIAIFYCYFKYILFHATREDDAPHRTIVYPTRTLVLGMRMRPLNYWSGTPTEPPNNTGYCHCSLLPSRIWRRSTIVEDTST